MDPLQQLERSVRRHRIGLIVVGFMFAAAGAAIMMGSWSHPGGSTGDNIAGWCFAGLMLLVGVLVFRGGVRASVERNPVYRVLRDQPGRVVWIYEEAGERARRVVLGIDDGQSRSISAASIEAQIALRNGLAARCTRATVGYNNERELLFKSTPAKLARA